MPNYNVFRLNKTIPLGKVYHFLSGPLRRLCFLLSLSLYIICNVHYKLHKRARWQKNQMNARAFFMNIITTRIVANVRCAVVRCIFAVIKL